jgi:hypothetical protein
MWRVRSPTHQNSALRWQRCQSCSFSMSRRHPCRRRNRGSPGASRGLGEQVATLAQLRALRLAQHWHLRRGDVAALLRGMRGAPAALRQLDVGGLHDMSDDDVHAMSPSLVLFTQVEVLDLSAFSLSERCAKVLAEALAGMPQLRGLHLDGGADAPEDVMLALLPAMSALTGLRVSSLARSKVTLPALRALCKACAGGRHELAVLDVSGHALSTKQADCARQLVATFTALQKLKLLVPEEYEPEEGGQGDAVADCEAYFNALAGAWDCEVAVDENGFHQREGAEQQMEAQGTLEGCLFEQL